MMHGNVLFWLLICGHLIGDFYFQPHSLVEKKRQSFLYLLLHSGIYAASMFLLLLPILNGSLVWAFLIISVSHFIIDMLKLWACDLVKEASPLRKRMFYIDQLIHIAIIIVVANIYATSYMIAPNWIGQALLEAYRVLQIGFDPTVALRFVFVFLLIGKPANILIREIKKSERNSEDLAGRTIGTLERILIVIMLILNQYAAIGLVFTAKSITRYDKISKDPIFAEYYLIGTLFSFLISVLAVLIVQPI